MIDSMSYPLNQWRLLITPPASGAWNMAVDEAILEAVGYHQSIACLRLYAWEPACLSLGYAQPSSDIDLSRLASLGWDWVRRPTGGRAILHTDELTYSVIAPQAESRVAGSLLESYQRLSAALLAALHSLNIPAETHPIANPAHALQNDPVCFEVPSNYEIVVGGKKLVGSAQARRKAGVLQHGTLPLYGDLTRITQVLSFTDEATRQAAARRLLGHATTVEMILGRRLSWQDAAQAFINGFQSELNLELSAADLTHGEKIRAQQLVVEKYSHPTWLQRI
jgi:lipoate-protein ligase A